MTDQLDQLRSALSGRYAVEREIGHGGMATVFAATDLQYERKVAIKVLRPELAAAVGRERFLREIKTIAQLSNPHILPLLDSGSVGDAPYYVMPFVEGESLRDRLNRENQLPLEVALEIARNVATALTYAHGHGIIHRDIKPENIMLESGEAVVTDFGIARALTAAGETLTSTGLAIGTPAYMSPEQSAGAGDLDARTDIYSLGTVVYEMLAGEPPYTGPNPQAVIAKRLTDAVPHLTTVRDVPEGVDGAVRKALARAPADRWQTTAEFITALGGERATTQRFAARPRRASKRTRLVGAGIAVAVFAVAAFIVLPMLRGGISSAGGGGRGANARVVTAPQGMVLAPGGAFTLFGGTCAHCLGAQAATLDSFYIDRTEVTVEAYRAYAKAAGATIPAYIAADGQFPMTHIMWPEAETYCRTRDSLTRLPTEQEWEASARGKGGRVYPWGNDWDKTRANAAGAVGRTVAVGSFAGGASEGGALDMAGNAWEWTSTPGPLTSDGRRQYIIRGGAFDTPPEQATMYFRSMLPEAVAGNERLKYYDKTGFRCMRRLR